MATSKLYGRNHVTFSSKIKAIFFDMDNTLIQTRKADVKTVNKVKTLSDSLMKIFHTSLVIKIIKLHLELRKEKIHEVNTCKIVF